MVYREVHRMELRELLRRWQAGESARAIARATSLARNTVGKYLDAAESLGLTPSGPEPTEDQLSQLIALGYTGCPDRGPGCSEALLLPHQAQIQDWLRKEQFQLTRVHEKLAEKGCIVPYSSLHRFVVDHQLAGRSGTTVRVADTAPGDYAEMDFGRLGYHLDPTTSQRRLIWALVVVLSYSRHLFLWPLLHQRLQEVIAGLEAAWAAFGGVPRHLILDNFPAAVAKPDPLSPRLTRGFLHYAQFRGFLPDPARVRHPKDKPRAERVVPYARERFFKGGSFLDLEDMRSQAARWALEVAGNRIHGTTRRKPLEVFRTEEQSLLLTLKPGGYQAPVWARVQVHVDHHVEFASALYSVPFDRCPPSATAEVCQEGDLVRIYYRGNLIKVHPRQNRGGRSTDPEDYPPEKSLYALRASDRLCQQAAELGPNIAQFAEKLLSGDLAWTRFRQAQKLLRLAQRYTPSRLEAACARALAFDLLDVQRLERILVQALDQEDSAAPGETATHTPADAPLPARFARPGTAFVHGAEVGATATNPSTTLMGGRNSV
mgnify:CR=1 FL=1